MRRFLVICFACLQFFFRGAINFSDKTIAPARSFILALLKTSSKQRAGYTSPKEVFSHDLFGGEQSYQLESFSYPISCSRHRMVQRRNQQRLYCGPECNRGPVFHPSGVGIGRLSVARLRQVLILIILNSSRFTCSKEVCSRARLQGGWFCILVIIASCRGAGEILRSAANMY
jgi:hypothetical protein